MFKETTWKEGELKIQEYMKKKGYKILYTNFSCVGVELDIVAILPKKVQIKSLKQEYKQKMLEDKKHKNVYKSSLKSMLKTIDDLLIITEVKARETDKYGLGSESISDFKKQNIIRGARFLQKDTRFEKMQFRFDVANVDAGQITYIQDAF